MSDLVARRNPTPRLSWDTKYTNGLALVGEAPEAFAALSPPRKQSTSERLWATVLTLAFDDLHSLHAQIRADAAGWFAAQSEEIHGVNWLCRSVGLDPDAVLAAARRRMACAPPCTALPIYEARRRTGAARAVRTAA
jgi:hypothetical protein